MVTTLIGTAQLALAGVGMLTAPMSKFKRR
jgi:hypothetical protein